MFAVFYRLYNHRKAGRLKRAMIKTIDKINKWRVSTLSPA